MADPLRFPTEPTDDAFATLAETVPRPILEAEVRRVFGRHAPHYLTALDATRGSGVEHVRFVDRLPWLPTPRDPEIILLPGILGSHLARPWGLPSRIWLSVYRLQRGGLSRYAPLAPDGRTDAVPPGGIRPDGILQIVYGILRLQLRRRGLVVHDFAFDWRKPVADEAERLHRFIEARPRRRFCLVAHSLGGLVAAMYAHQQPGWRDRIASAVFMGVPLAGAFEAASFLLGTSWIVRAIAAVGRDTTESLQRLGRTLPGVLDLLPNPAIFKDAAHGAGMARLFDRAAWPDAGRPLQTWLDASRDGRPHLLDSPLLERTTVLCAQRHATLASLDLADGTLRDGRHFETGDGTVPARSACAPGAKAHYALDWSHALLPAEPATADAITAVVRRAPVTLPRLDPTLAGAALPAPVSSALEGVDDALRERVAAGRFNLDDLAWIFDGAASTV